MHLKYSSLRHFCFHACWKKVLEKSILWPFGMDEGFPLSSAFDLDMVYVITLPIYCLFLYWIINKFNCCLCSFHCLLCSCSACCKQPWLCTVLLEEERDLSCQSCPMCSHQCFQVQFPGSPQSSSQKHVFHILKYILKSHYVKNTKQFFFQIDFPIFHNFSIIFKYILVTSAWWTSISVIVWEKGSVTSPMSGRRNSDDFLKKNKFSTFQHLGPKQYTLHTFLCSQCTFPGVASCMLHWIPLNCCC